MGKSTSKSHWHGSTHLQSLALDTRRLRLGSTPHHLLELVRSRVCLLLLRFFVSFVVAIAGDSFFCFWFFRQERESLAAGLALQAYAPSRLVFHAVMSAEWSMLTFTQSASRICFP
mmetsp:Transcript_104388/g.164748  ORF Transcript_104388/g.164748 Transcript_104388/m.164748 type:complete len:116 (-) Transcript_104388:22-369(-)